MANAQPNRPLNGKELKKIILKDVENILDQDGMLMYHIAYSSVAYSITVKIMTNNPVKPVWPSRTSSQKASIQQVEANPELAAITTFPLARSDGDEGFDVGVERLRDIESPNQSRIENDLPVPVTIRNQDGQMEEKEFYYDKDPNDPFPDAVRDRTLTEAEILQVDRE